MDSQGITGQIRIAEEDKKKTTFATEWGSYAQNVMPVYIIHPKNIVLRATPMWTSEYKPCPSESDLIADRSEYYLVEVSSTFYIRRSG